MASPHPFSEFSRAKTLKEAIDAFEIIKSHEPSLSADSFRGTPLAFFELIKDKTADSVHIATRIFSATDDVKESKEYGPMREWCASYQVLIVGAGLARWSSRCGIQRSSWGERSKVAEEFGFAKKDLQFGQAIGITANFALSNAQAERDLKESGFISYLYKDLENLVYYRSDRNYFVFTAKKESLAEAGMFKEVKADSSELCAGTNIEKECLERVLGKCRPSRSGNDVVLFDFSKKTVVRTPSKVIDAPYGTHLVVGVVGDAAINPFWPQGTGAAHALISSLDFCWLLTDVAPHLSLQPGSTPFINSHSRSVGTTSTPDPNTPFHPNPDIAACFIAHDCLHSPLQTAKPDTIKRSVRATRGKSENVQRDDEDLYN
ncbi:hypothetical protein M427DRAFT_36722 [Gonapodya prolifera JEL478]|uniref:[F-actin]-monooxygenase MICAL1-3-like Rossman domain-containing protein n=1 Tax=Gonapodya prolifera (strain JEL478) TaxID=1344416 RepID=A0A139A2X2_GONPJ|nr:hypothetical protein M427DRAFT_36722 [Gonapodya prolifera JEL478]|eukprot:KXS10713.1 hypothetical protein M427DRAFT_36722 [Gonapodya prolifera JEL478]